MNADMAVNGEFNLLSHFCAQTHFDFNPPEQCPGGDIPLPGVRPFSTCNI